MEHEMDTRFVEGSILKDCNVESWLIAIIVAPNSLSKHGNADL